MSEPALQLKDLTMAYGDGQARRLILDGLSTRIEHGEFVSIVGPSGIGKTTLLRCLSGLTRPTSGSVWVAGREITGPPSEIAIVFQDYSRSLMPWFSVQKNVALPLIAKGLKRTRAYAEALHALESVGLQDTGDKFPWQLSGGMQQRVAIARGLAFKPQVMVMDEPFASVDAQTRLELEDLVVRLHRELAMTTIFVTHDIDEAVYLSDRIVVLAGPPARIAESIDIELPSPRTQLATRAVPEFSVYRTRVLEHIYRGLDKGAVRP